MISAGEESMRRVIISYPFIYYSLYRYYLTKWEFSSDWPQGWAVVALSMLLALLVKAIELTLSKIGITPLATDLLSSLPAVLISGWAFILSMLINFYVFFVQKKWLKYVQRYDNLPELIKWRSHLASGVIIAIILLTYFARLLTFENLRY